MIEIGKIVAEWPKDKYGWSISPGVQWLGEGKIGARIIIDGAGSSMGEESNIGEESRLGAGSNIGAWSNIGAGSNIGEESSIGAGSSLGEESSLGAGSTAAIDIGFADGYRKCIAEVKGVAHIGAGCRWFTLRDALKHWGGHSEDRRMTMALLESAKAIAALKGWKLS